MRSDPPGLYIFVIGFIALTILMAALPVPNGRPEYPQRTLQESAWVACIFLAQERAKLDQMDVDLYARNSVIMLVERDHYGVIVYTMNGSSFQCDLARQIGGRWFLKSLYVR